jgi:hypothetical protein
MTDSDGQHVRTLTEMRSLRLELHTVLEQLQEFARGRKAQAARSPPAEMELEWDPPPQRNFKYGRRLIPAFAVRVSSGRLSRATTLEVGIVEASSGQGMFGVLKGELTARFQDGVATFSAVILHLLARPSLKRMLSLRFVVRAVGQGPADPPIRPLVSRTVIVHNRPHKPFFAEGHMPRTSSVSSFVDGTGHSAEDESEQDESEQGTEEKDDDDDQSPL